MSNVSGWLPNLIGPVEVQNEGTAMTARAALNFIGCTINDNPTFDRTDIEAPVQAMGGSCSGTTAACVVERVDGVGNNVDVTCAQTTWGIATSGIIAKILAAPVVTTDATLTTLLSFPVPTDTVGDFVITVVGRRTGGVSGTAGDCYRADFPVCYQRIGSAAPTLVGSAAAETGKKSNGGGSAYLGSIAVSGNNILVKATGVVDTTIHWTAVIQGQQVG